MSKINVQLLQINSSYGNQYFIPYSVGLLQSFSNEFPEIRESYNFKKLVYKQETDLNKQIRDLGPVDIFGQSCYVWNYQFNLAFARIAKEQNPDALIVLGGPQVPDNSKGFFDKYPFVDILCHGEGEVVFYEILKRYKDKKDYGTIEGVSFNDRVNKKTVQTNRAKVSVDLEKMPSPYLDGTFSNLMEENVLWQASWETNRGCPYRCSFCVWGSEYYNKIRKFNFKDRLLKEIDWFSENKIDLVFGCDANFGIFPRDLDIAKALVTNKEKYGFPKKFRVCNAKNSSQLVYQISETLNNAGMDKGTSMSVQSMSPEVLGAIKRENIGLDKFKDLMSKFNQSSIPTYTEIILPLPKETFKSFVGGLDTLFHGGQHNQLNIYNCTILMNSEMGSEAYMQEHGIKTVECPVFRAHVDNTVEEYIPEIETIAVGTKTMPTEDWKKCQQYSWAAQAFHTLGLLQNVSIVLINRYNVNYSDFYLSLIEYAEKYPNTILGKEITYKNETTEALLNGRTQGQLVPEYNLNIIWPSEEATLLRALDNIDVFYTQCIEAIKYFALKFSLCVEDDFLKELVAFQKELMVHYSDNGQTAQLKMNYNLGEYISDIKNGIPAKLVKYAEPKICDIIKLCKTDGDKKKFAKEIVWFGRKGGKFLNKYKI